MTRLPAESWNVEACEGDLYPKYKVQSMCAHPACTRFVDHVHHIVRRSFIGGDISWVKFPNGDIVGNLCGLCYRHHDEVTVNKGHIAYEERLHQFTWVGEDGFSLGRLNPEPPVHGRVPVVTDQEGLIGPGSTPLCPGCKRPLPHPVSEHSKREPARRRKTWVVKVPDDADEDGALVLDTLLEECGRLFNRDMSQSNTRYYVLAQTLALVVQNSHLLS